MAGQVLARLHDAEQAAILRAQNTEFERKLVAYLQSPADPGVKQALAALVAATRQRARERRVPRDPRAARRHRQGACSSRDGQRVEPGTDVLSIVEAGRRGLSR